MSEHVGVDRNITFSFAKDKLKKQWLCNNLGKGDTQDKGKNACTFSPLFCLGKN